MKICNRCQQSKPYSCFGLKNAEKLIYQSSCKECHNEYTKKHYQLNKSIYLENADKNRKRKHSINREIVDNTKLVGCKYCNEKEICCLDFHHINDDKEYTISKMMHSYGKKKLLLEISKCEVVCANCHRKLHAGKL